MIRACIYFGACCKSIDVLVITIDNRVRIPEWRSLKQRFPALCDELEAEFTYSNPDYFRNKHLGIRGKPPPRTIATFTPQAGDAMSFPRGGFSRIRAALKRQGVVFDVDLNVSRGDDSIGVIPEHRVDLRPFQRELSRAGLVKREGLIRSPAGSGKTTVALSLIAQVNLPALVIVSNSNLVTQWTERCVAELGVSRKWCGVIQGSTRRIGPVTIAMMQTLEHCVEDYQHLFGVVLVDEVQRAAASTLYRVVDHMHADYRLGFSDDERRSDGKHFLIHDLFGDIIAEAKHQDLVDDGFIIDPDIICYPTAFDIEWFHMLEPPEQAMAKDKVLQVMTDDQERNDLIAWIASRHHQDGQPTLVMSDRREHVLELDRTLGLAGLRTGYILGGTGDKTASADTISRLRSGALDGAVGTYQACGTGVDLPKLARAIFATPIANSSAAGPQFKQFRGRVARPGKDGAEIAYLWDVRLYGSKPLANLCRWSKRVKVWRGGRLVPGRDVLKEIQREEEDRDREQDPYRGTEST